MSEETAEYPTVALRQTPQEAGAEMAGCPTAGVCPPCREGWGHWDGTRYVPTSDSTRKRCSHDGHLDHPLGRYGTYASGRDAEPCALTNDWGQ